MLVFSQNFKGTIPSLTKYKFKQVEIQGLTSEFEISKRFMSEICEIKSLISKEKRILSLKSKFWKKQIWVSLSSEENVQLKKYEFWEYNLP